MSETSLFQAYWSKYCNRPDSERSRYFTSLSLEDRRHLIQSFFNEGWHELFIYNIIEDNLDFIKSTYDIDVVDLKIQAQKFNRVFLIEKRIWDHIIELLQPYSDYYSFDLNLVCEPWGKRQQFYRVYSQRRVNGKSKK